MRDGVHKLPIGLSQQEAERRLRNDGRNEISRDETLLWHVQIWRVLREPMFLLLAVACSIYFFLGSKGEALVLSGALLGVVLISVVQERRAQNALAALRSLTSPRARVIRERSERLVPGGEIVRGDILHVMEGDRVAADALLIESMHLQVDESMLTGESAAVPKRPGQAPREGGEATHFAVHESQCSLFAGTLVVQGDGYAIVYATGKDTEMGKVGLSLASISSEISPLQKQIKRLVVLMATVGIGTSAILFLVFGLRDDDWLRGVLSAVSVAMSLLPEEFPIVLTLFLSIGAWRLSRQRILTRHLPAIETLGAASVLCVDKTGTLTQNRMKISGAWRPGMEILVNIDTVSSLARRWRHLLTMGAWASHPRAFDPMERAFYATSRRLKRQGSTRRMRCFIENERDWTLEHIFPMTNERLAVVHVWKQNASGRRRIAAKGAPEAIIRLCKLTPAAEAEISGVVHKFAHAGRRVLAIAVGAPMRSRPSSLDQIHFRFSGVVAFHDPLRPRVPESVACCRQAGLRIVMITGDYPDTATAIAKEAGIPHATETVTGAEIENCSDVDLKRLGMRAAVFARARPHHKLQLVRALQANGHVVAMTGDGVNDAPALRAAEIGVAMGGRGSDVAREASAIVVTDDNFTSIVDAIRTGRTIYDNLQKSMSYLVAVHVLIAGVAIWPVLFGGPMVLLPLHIVFLEMIIDPSCSIAFEAEASESDVMSRPPRPRNQSLFPTRLLSTSLLQGLSACLICVLVFEWGRLSMWTDEAIRALVFTALLSGNLMLILVNLSWSRSAASILRGKNRPALILFLAAILLLISVFRLNWLRELFQFGIVPSLYVFVAFMVGGASVLWFEWVKKRRIASPAD